MMSICWTLKRVKNSRGKCVVSLDSMIKPPECGVGERYLLVNVNVDRKTSDHFNCPCDLNWLTLALETLNGLSQHGQYL